MKRGPKPGFRRTSEQYLEDVRNRLLTVLTLDGSKTVHELALRGDVASIHYIRTCLEDLVQRGSVIRQLQASRGQGRKIAVYCALPYRVRPENQIVPLPTPNSQLPTEQEA